MPIMQERQVEQRTSRPSQSSFTAIIKKSKKAWKKYLQFNTQGDYILKHRKSFRFHFHFFSVLLPSGLMECMHLPNPSTLNPALLI